MSDGPEGLKISPSATLKSLAQLNPFATFLLVAPFFAPLVVPYLFAIGLPEQTARIARLLVTNRTDGGYGLGFLVPDAVEMLIFRNPHCVAWRRELLIDLHVATEVTFVGSALWWICFSIPVLLLARNRIIQKGTEFRVLPNDTSNVSSAPYLGAGTSKLWSAPYLGAPGPLFETSGLLILVVAAFIGYGAVMDLFYSGLDTYDSCLGHGGRYQWVIWAPLEAWIDILCVFMNPPYLIMLAQAHDRLQRLNAIHR